jgi:hypothetical protein
MSEALATAIIVALIAALPGIVFGIVAQLRIKELHIILNSRLTELLVSVRAEGVSEGERNAKV